MATNWIDTVDAAKILNRSPNTLAKWRQFRMGPSYRLIGGRVRYDRAEIERMRDGEAAAKKAGALAYAGRVK